MNEANKQALITTLGMMTEGRPFILVVLDPPDEGGDAPTINVASNIKGADNQDAQRIVRGVLREAAGHLTDSAELRNFQLPPKQEPGNN
jgi:hypothetical protein